MPSLTNSIRPSSTQMLGVLQTESAGLLFSDSDGEGTAVTAYGFNMVVEGPIVVVTGGGGEWAGGSDLMVS